MAISIDCQITISTVVVSSECFQNTLKFKVFHKEELGIEELKMKRIN